MNQKNLLEVDWSKIPAPTDDGAAKHLVGKRIPPLSLARHRRHRRSMLSTLTGRTVVFAYPRTGEPGKISLVDDWDMIPGARGCTPQTCSFRDLFAELKAAGAKHVFGLSTQDNVYQTEMASRLHLPFPVLSDEKLALSRALKLPTMEVAGLTLIKRLALIVDNGVITHVFYPVFPPDRNAGDVLAWLQDNPVLILLVLDPDPRAPSRTPCGTSPASAPACSCCSASNDRCRRAGTRPVSCTAPCLNGAAALRMPSAFNVESWAMRPSATMARRFFISAIRAIRNCRQVLISTGSGLFCGGTQCTALPIRQSTSLSPSSGRA